MNDRRVVDAVIAGAVGSSALNAVSYLDMVLRARPASQTPEQSDRRLSEITRVGLGPEDRAANRRSGLGPLLGYGLGMAGAAVYAVAVGRRRLPTPVAAALLGGTVMALSDGSLTALGVTDPRRWRRADWLADVVPHLAYGFAAAVTWYRLRTPGR